MADGGKKEEDNGEARAMAPIEFSATPVLNKLLKPSAEYLGGELKELLRTSIESLKDRVRPKNIQDHIREAFKDSSPEYDGEQPRTLQQLELFEKWVHGAEDIPADGSPLARMWQELLRRIRAGDTNDAHLIDTLKRVTPAEAAALLRLRETGILVTSDKEDFYLQRLAEYGLVDRPIWPVIRRSIPFPAALLILYGVSVAIEPFAEVAFSTMGLSASSRFLQAVFVFFTACYLFMAVRRLTVRPWTLTWIGTELVSYAERDVAQAANQTNQKATQVVQAQTR